MCCILNLSGTPQEKMEKFFGALAPEEFKMRESDSHYILPRIDPKLKEVDYVKGPRLHRLPELFTAPELVCLLPHLPGMNPRDYT